MYDVKTETVEHNLKFSNRRHFFELSTHEQNFMHSGYACLWSASVPNFTCWAPTINLLKTEGNLLYIMKQSVPRNKHFPTRL